MLTERGRSLLESHRHDRHHDHHQEFYAELKKPREMEHDAQIYSAYLREAERLQKRGERIERVVLDYELKREYQELQQLFFPEGVAFDGKRFVRTAVTCLAFTQLAELGDRKSGLASPTGFGPVFWP